MARDFYDAPTPNTAWQAIKGEIEPELSSTLSTVELPKKREDGESRWGYAARRIGAAAVEGLQPGRKALKLITLGAAASVAGYVYIMHDAVEETERRRAVFEQMLEENRQMQLDLSEPMKIPEHTLKTARPTPEPMPKFAPAARP